MGLVDIFGQEGKTQGPVDPRAHVAATVGAQDDTPFDLAGKASSVAEAADRAAEASLRYKARREELLRGIESQLAPLKSSLDQTSKSYDTAKQELMDQMNAAGLTKLPMLGRDPIRIRTSKGRKKSITKKWLTSEFGTQTGDSIWDRVPTGPDSRDLVVPSPYDDQPSD